MAVTGSLGGDSFLAAGTLVCPHPSVPVMTDAYPLPLAPHSLLSHNPPRMVSVHTMKPQASSQVGTMFLPSEGLCCSGHLPSLVSFSGFPDFSVSFSFPPCRGRMQRKPAEVKNTGQDSGGR